MKKRLLALLLCLALLFSAAPVFAAEETEEPETARDTSFFTPQEHADVNFKDMKYQAVDVDAVTAEMAAVAALAADAANADQVRSGFLAACDTYKTAHTMYILASIYSDQDYANAQKQDRCNTAYENLLLVRDALFCLVRDIVNSPCAAALNGVVSQEDQAELAEYAPLTQEELETASTEQSLTQSYFELADGEYASDDERNAALGALYLQLVELRKAEAAAAGYDNYADYAYELIYDRDYTKEDMQAFHAAVKKNIVPTFERLLDSFYSATLTYEVYYGAYTGDVALDMMDPYVAELSDELYESFSYMRAHGLYDSTYSSTKSDQGYTTMLYSYGAPFFFDQPTGIGLNDFSTAVHEFGHYNNDYWTAPDWYCGGKSVDVSEVHSQALELLFTAYYPQLFGESGEGTALFRILNILGAIIDGAMYDELEQYVFATDNVTLEQINAKYGELQQEYGADGGDWVDIPHTFQVPFYYISYAVSAAGGFAFWLNAQEDFMGTVDDYLRFTALDAGRSFQESFAAIGYESPTTPSYLKRLGKALRQSTSTLPFKDVDVDAWYYSAVSFAYANQLFSGTSATTFAPGGYMTRSMAVTVLYRLMGKPAVSGDAEPFRDVKAGSWYEDAVYWARENGITKGVGNGKFGVNDSITRQDLAVMLYHIAQTMGQGFTEDWNVPLDFPDAGDVSGYANEAMHWMVLNGVINGANGKLNPRGTATRAEVAKMLMSFCAVMDAALQ